MKATILHDEHGRIVAVSQSVDLQSAGSKFVRFGMVPGSGQRVSQIELSEEFEKRPLQELHQEFRLDIAAAKLVKKTESY
jgi:hypothetical protein